MKRIKEDEIKQTLFRLAHFNPNAQDDWGNQILDYLVLDSLVTFGPLLQVSATDIKNNIRKGFHLVFEEAEIIASGKRLYNKKMINYSGAEPQDEEKGKNLWFQILPETKKEIEKNLPVLEDLEKEVMTEWKEEIIKKYKDLPIVENKIDLMENNLRTFISKMFMRHGIECVVLLYPEEEKVQRWLTTISGSIFSDLIKVDNFIDSITILEIPRFFKSANKKRRSYINNLFNGSFFWHTVQIDEKCSRLLRKVTKGQKLFLDNNILFSLVGLHGEYLLKSVHNILEMAKTLGYKLLITSKTISEFNESLKFRLREVKVIPRELARIAVNNLNDDNFMVCYWKQFIATGISIEEFAVEKSHIEEILQGLEIDIVHKHRKDIESSPELLQEQSILRQVAHAGTDEHIIEHDAFHRVFINKIRKGEKYKFSDAVAWFLTHDTKLPSYDKVARKGKQFLPFCLLSNQWVQLNRPLLPRTSNIDDYEESYYTLVTQPCLRALLSSLPMERAYNEVLGKIAHYKNSNRQLTLDIVADTHFMITIASESDQEKISEKIENKFVDLSIQLQEDKDKLAEEKRALGEKIIKDENKHQKQIDELKTTSEQKIASAKEEARDKEKELVSFKRQTDLRSTNLRLGITLAVTLLSEILLIYFAATYGEGENVWQKIVSSWAPIVFIPPFICALLGRFFIGKKRLALLGSPWDSIFKQKQ